jgi:hypothetical protein
MKIGILVLIISIGNPLNAQWMQTNLGDAQIGNNLYATDTEVLAATLNGVYSTTDTGDPWFSIGLSGRLVFDVITSNQYILAATEGTGPGVYRTSDHGSNWIETKGMEGMSVWAFTKNNSYVFAATWGNGVFRSSDDGANWQPLGPANGGFRTIYAVGNTIFAGSDSIYFSTNNGEKWQSRHLPYPAGDTWCFYYTNGILYAGDFGLYSSTDLGDTWQLKYGVTFDNQGNVVDSKIIKDITSYQNVLIASVASYDILISYDDGKNWNSFNEGFDYPDWTFAALAIKAPNIWALRQGFGNAYMRPLFNITSTEDEPLTLPNDYKLFQNYPNPFNPNTNIGFQIAGSGYITLKIYDVLGNEVETLVDDYKSAGKYEIELHAADLPTGVYFYRLTAGNFSETKKLLLMK